MIERDPIGNDARRRRQVARLGTNPSCLLCSERDLDTLRPLPAPLLEEHHIAGRANDPNAAVILCRNCHAKATAGMLRGGMQLAQEDGRSAPEKIVQFLHGLALFFEMLAAACEGWAVRLTSHVASLDANLPAWRELPQPET